MRPTFICLIISLVVHFLVLGWALMSMTTAPKFAVEMGKDSVEIDLLAAGPKPVAATVPSLPKPEALRPESAPVKKSSRTGPHPGRDAVTARSSAGATLASKPAYLRNPPPVYPEQARLQKQEGVVILDVSVDAEGLPARLVVSDSSHYPLLDQAAIKAVSHWRFRPASLGGFNVESHALVPVRFELEAR